jgi:hypothetical protein
VGQKRKNAYSSGNERKRVTDEQRSDTSMTERRRKWNDNSQIPTVILVLF